MRVAFLSHPLLSRPTSVSNIGHCIHDAPKCSTQPPSTSTPTPTPTPTSRHLNNIATNAKHTTVALALCIAALTTMPECGVAGIASARATDAGASGGADIVDVRPQLKISGGSASTTGGLGGRKTVFKTVTRGVTLEDADFSNSDFEGVSFQQSILRRADFSNSVLRNASFFDADLTGAIFVNAEMSSVNLELANVRGANLTGANLTGAYISSTTKLNGVVIDDSDWTDTLLRKDQQNFLCSIAKGTNPITGADTRETLMCPPE